MAIPSNRPQNRILLVGGILFALLAGVVVYLAVSKSSPSASSTPTVPVVVASTTINAGSQLSAANLISRPYPEQDVPADSFTAPSQLIGKTIPTTISAGTPITQQLLNSTSPETGTAANTATPFTIAEGYVALAIPATGSAGGSSVDQMTVGYYVQTGDQIDILVELGGSTTTSYAVDYAFQDVPVLAVGYASGSTASPSASPAATTLPVPSYFVVEMPRYEAEMMTAVLSGNFAQSSGSPATAGNPPVVLKYVLRPSADYGKFTVDNAVTPHTVTFTPNIINLPSGDTEPVTPSQLAQALGG
ncbi:MAG: Flp pilus assembly protein CpaB [Candidatus Dormibacteria bacterium]